MSVEKDLHVQILNRIKDRYFRKIVARPEGMLVHFGDCSVYDSIHIYDYAPCDCGFNYDLDKLGGLYDQKLNLNAKNEDIKRWGRKKFDPIETAKARKLLEATFGVNWNSVDPEREKREWEVIEEVFGAEYVQFLRDKHHDKICDTCGYYWCTKEKEDCPECKWVERFYPEMQRRADC